MSVVITTPKGVEANTSTKVLTVPEGGETFVVFSGVVVITALERGETTNSPRWGGIAIAAREGVEDDTPTAVITAPGGGETTVVFLGVVNITALGRGESSDKPRWGGVVVAHPEGVEDDTSTVVITAPEGGETNVVFLGLVVITAPEGGETTKTLR